MRKQAVAGIFEAFSESAKIYPSRTAVSFKHKDTYQAISYQELLKQTIQFGNAFLSRDVKRLDRVVLLLDNGPQWLGSCLGIHYCNAIAVPLDTSFNPDTIAERINFCQPKLVLCQEKHLPKLKLFIEEDKDHRVVVIDSPEFLHELEAASFEVSGTRTFSAPEEPAIFFHTSGTTNTPKVVMLSHKNLLSNADSAIKLGIAHTADVFISILPLYHSYSFMATFLLPFMVGAQISYPASLNSDELMDCMQKTGVSIIAGVPQIFLLFHSRIKESLAKLSWPKRLWLGILIDFFWFMRKAARINIGKIILSRLHQRFGKRLRFMISGGARLEPSVALDFFKWGFTLLEGYGVTEASPAVTWNSPDRPRIGSVGKPIPGVELKILNPDEQGIGEVVFKGANIMLGYYQQQEDTLKARIESWYLSGDMGYLDKDGYLYLLARRDDLIVLSSGKKVNPEEIEKHYSACPSLKEICVFSSDAPGFLQGSRQLAAVVVPNQEYFKSRGIVNIEERLKWELDNFSQKLPSFKRITGIVLRKEPLPRTALGKIMRHKVKAGLNTASSSRDQQAAVTKEDWEDEPLLAYLSKRFRKKVSRNDNLALDLGLDSLSRMELLLQLQQFFGVKFTDELMNRLFFLTTVEELSLAIKPLLPGEVLRLGEEKLDWKVILSGYPGDDKIKEIHLASSIGAKLATLVHTGFLRTLCKAFFLLKVNNRAGLPDTGAILYGNHSNYLDGVFIAASLPLGLLQKTFFAGFRKYVTHPILKKVFRLTQFVPIDTDYDLVASLQLCAYLLRNKKNIVLFPEGQRSIDGKVKTFKKGIGILAKELDIPLIPVYIEGAFRSWPRNRLLPRPAKITVTFGRAIRLKGGESYESIAEQLRQELLNTQPAV